MNSPSLTTAQANGVQGGWTPRLAVSTVLLAMVLEALALGAAMISIALPSILQVFPTDQGGWLLSAYFLTGTISAPILGKCADLYGKRKILLLAMTISGLGALVCALAPSLPFLFAGRAMQGVIMAALALTYSLIRDVYPPKPAAFAASITVTGMGLFGLVSPLLIGWLLASFGFRGMFWFDAIWTFALVILIWLITPESALRRKARPDVIGGALLTAGVLGILLYVSLGRTIGWTSAVGLGLLFGGIALLAIFFAHTRRASEPIINLSLFLRRPVVFVVLLGSVGYALSSTMAVILPMLAMTSPADGITYGLGLTTVEYAVVEIPKSLAATVVGVVLGFLVARGRSPRMFMILGMVCWPLSALSLAFSNDTVPALLIGAVLAGMGGGMVNAALPNVVMQSVPAGDQGSSAGAVQLCTGAVGASAPVLLFAALAPHASPTAAGGIVYAEQGFHTWLIGCAIVAVVAVVLALTVLRSRPSDRIEIVPSGPDQAAVPASAADSELIGSQAGSGPAESTAGESRVPR
jgi:MFS family permease